MNDPRTTAVERRCQWVQGGHQCGAPGTVWAATRWLCREHFKAWLLWPKYRG